MGDPEIGERIRLAINAAALKQSDLANHLGVSEQTIRNWVAGRHNVSVAHLSALAEALGVSRDWILTGQQREIDAERLLQEMRAIRKNQEKLSDEIRAMIETRQEELDTPPGPS